MIEILKYNESRSFNLLKGKGLRNIELDWYGEQRALAPQFAFFRDGECLVFVMRMGLPVFAHPEAEAGEFKEELWKYDVGEFFLADPQSGHYLEFNLAPNGAWWSCFFNEPRVPVMPNEALAGVVTESWVDEEKGEVTALARIPLSSLRSGAVELFSEDSLLNATFILGSGETTGQKFFTAAPLPGSEPNFHQPKHFSRFVVKVMD